MLFFPNAKINIGLGIINKRDDGFHDIETMFYPIPLFDALEFVLAPSDSESDRFTQTGINIGGGTEKNIVLRAIDLLREHRYIPYLNIHLHKSIPVGGGLGGGSSDAAFMLRYLNRYFSFGFTNEFLKEQALKLGSDCPFFIDNQPCIGKGRGEILTPVEFSLKGYWLLLTNPGTGVNTGCAYAASKPRRSELHLEERSLSPPRQWQESLVNDFEKVVFPSHPEISDLKDNIREMGAVYSAMSGSGASVYGLFNQRPRIPASINNQIVFNGRL